jgi:5'-nucleotidase, C-terminal domain
MDADHEETSNRSRETEIGDWVTNLLLRTTKADVAIINSGILGLNEDLAPGTDLTLKHVVDMFRFDDVVAVWEFPADLVCQAISHGLREPGLGAWPHVGGVEVEIKPLPDGKNEATVRRFINQPNITCRDRAAKIKVAGVPFLLCGGDKYPLKAVPGDACARTVRDMQLSYPPGDIERGQKLSDITEAEIRAAHPGGIKPEKDGRLVTR